MRSLLIFLAACGGIVLTGWLVSKRTGSRAFYIEDWKLEPDETTLWRDDGADTYAIGKYGQAKVMSFARLRRGCVVVTNKRILVGTKPLFGKKRMVQYVLSTKPSPESGNLDGGLLTKGYQSIVLQPGAIEAHLDQKKPYIDLTPLSGEASSTNLQTIRIFTDNGATFRLP